jgi:PAS domain S-box-containing protein
MPSSPSKKQQFSEPFEVHASTGRRRIEVESLLDSIGDGAIMTDEFGRITRINPVALNVLGYQEEELLGKWFPKVIESVNEDGKQTPLIDRPISKAFLTGKAISEKMSYKRKNGVIIPVSVTVSPMMIGDTPVGAIEVFRDITLEHEIDRMKSEFISLASHQLRTPLSAIKTYTHMLLDEYMGPIKPSQRKALKTIVTASNRMNELISTLLNITRIESGSIAVVPKLIDMRLLADEVLSELNHIAQDRQINLSLKVPKTPAPARTDNLIAKEILSNLVSNAIKYTPQNGSVTISVSSKQSCILISVSDTGFGIPKHSQDQVFTKFFRAHNVVMRETNGTGLGLYLVKGLVEALKGKISFVSEENKGTTFYFSLPRAMARKKSNIKAKVV